MTIQIRANRNILNEMGIPDHTTCLLRNLYSGQEATVRAGHETKDWFQIGKGVHQGCIMSPCLFFFFSIYFYQLEANYFTILQWFLPYIDMNQPWIYMCSPSRSPLLPPSPPDPSASSQCTSPEHLSHASNLGW